MTNSEQQRRIDGYDSGCPPPITKTHACFPEPSPRDAHGQPIPKEWVEHAQRLALEDQVGNEAVRELNTTD